MAKVVQRCQERQRPHLVLVEADESFGGSEGLLDAPALTGHGHQCAQWHRARAVAA